MLSCGRRVALHVLGAAALAGCSDPNGGTDDAGSEPGPCSGLGTKVGATTDFAPGTWKLHGAIVVSQDGGGFFAYTAICTHQGCVIDAPSSNGTSTCPCHGSQFDGNGAVLSGPATLPLDHYLVTLCEGNVYVNTKKVVDASTRTPA